MRVIRTPTFIDFPKSRSRINVWRGVAYLELTLIYLALAYIYPETRSYQTVKRKICVCMNMCVHICTCMHMCICVSPINKYYGSTHWNISTEYVANLAIERRQRENAIDCDRGEENARLARDTLECATTGASVVLVSLCVQLSEKAHEYTCFIRSRSPGQPHPTVSAHCGKP